ncbi:hypothetical protein GGTG_13678 [Gaeumannomyces tritici R3-111a-1]|uniref:Uncharacterized protein n=1 Tax=Gaeumannomyces tritici (strain R3-111a-1) TaxID=644352 RepID=J3PJJ2_GAET3|nr:hypothetical protein GGTG_13678 [Gaeumannomyces tritici R3-111a-1]EJT68748.1 hypothetical protein GGTG_13678 [Gaeumannomyces tritici R3-111a-1]
MLRAGRHNAKPDSPYGSGRRNERIKKIAKWPNWSKSMTSSKLMGKSFVHPPRTGLKTEPVLGQQSADGS